ncbi:uncharacterized protein [Halyomorpha halys]|uniref:uncharacterized protein n=1 Tax=Halyomorpha halys TaxID=286706 RepID=UPI0034D38767
MTIVRPVLLHGCETWTTSRACEQELLVFEKRILRRIYGGVLIRGEWKRRKSQLCYTMLVTVRMSSEDPPRQLLMEPLHGTRRRGRPKLRRADGVAADATNMLERRNWMAVARDRENWRKLLEEARIRHRIVEPQ